MQQSYKRVTLNYFHLIDKVIENIMSRLINANKNHLSLPFTCKQNTGKSRLSRHWQITTYYNVKFWVYIHNSACKREAAYQHTNKQNSTCLWSKQNQQGCHLNQPTYLCRPQREALTLAAQQKYPAPCTAVCLHGPLLCSWMFRCSVPLRFDSGMKA